MAKHCEYCGGKIGGFFTATPIALWKSEDGKPHEFCSQECKQDWIKKPRKDAIREKYGEITPNLMKDLNELYFKKKAEYDTLLNEMGVAMLADGDDEVMEIEARMDALKEEILDICAVIGREPDF